MPLCYPFIRQFFSMKWLQKMSLPTLMTLGQDVTICNNIQCMHYLDFYLQHDWQRSLFDNMPEQTTIRRDSDSMQQGQGNCSKIAGFDRWSSPFAIFYAMSNLDCWEP